MNRNTEHFGYAPMQNSWAGRSKFYRPTKRLFTFSAGGLYPFYWDDILPGDTVKIDTRAVVRMLTPLYPVMDDLAADIYYFFVPNRIIWDHWEEFQKENKLTAWEQPIDYTIPKIIPPSGGWNAKTLADYLELPPGLVDSRGFNHLPFRRYCNIWNEWFRSESLKDRALFNTDDTTLTGTNSGSYITNAQLGGRILMAGKTRDYFTRRLPAPLKSSVSVAIPMGGGYGVAPVTTKSGAEWQVPVNKALTWVRTGNSPVTPLDDSKKYKLETAHASVYATGIQSTYGSVSTDTLTSSTMGPSNLWANLRSGNLQLTSTINDLRQAVAVQRIYEALARGGSRYTETLRNIWNVDPADSRLQRPEYLGGGRYVLNIDQVLQTSATGSNTTPLGETGAFSNTYFENHNVEKSFTEHGIIMGLITVRVVKHTYNQGVQKKWTRSTYWDYYQPELRHLSEMRIKNKEIYAQGSSVVDSDGNIVDDQVFGYQEAWADYRYNPNQVMGEMRTTYAQSLDAWHYADHYTQLPTLSSSWIDEDPANVNRTLAVSNNTADQFFADILVDLEHTRVMPVYSIPGLDRL